jgi:phosphatidylserine decarboxylase
VHAIVEKLKALIRTNRWENAFQQAIRKAQSHDVPSIKNIQTLDDYLKYVDNLVTWAPSQPKGRNNLYNRLVEFYFFLDQEPVKSLQSPIQPSKRPKKLTPLSEWIVEYANAWGSYLDTPDSAKHVATFQSDPTFNWDEYMPPPSGYLTFNQFFARHVKPGMRPIAALSDDRVLVAPADSRFVGWWQISENSKISVEPKLEIKGMQWSISQLLEGSAYADQFKGGIFTHSFLNTFDYHRWHTPVCGKVVESRVIQGQAYIDITVQPAMIDGQTVNALSVLDGTGYQFVQTRGLVVIDSPIGLVACLPMGMGQVSSVVITAETGKTLHKGEELGYFQFGGSDFVMVFERASNVQLISRKDVHVNQGTWIGNAFPYTLK